MNERLKYEGKRSLANNELRRVELSIKTLIAVIRDELDPTSRLDRIDFEKAAANAVELGQKAIERAAIVAEIAAIDQALGR